MLQGTDILKSETACTVLVYITLHAVFVYLHKPG